jgi:hypothetical protein
MPPPLQAVSNAKELLAAAAVGDLPAVMDIVWDDADLVVSCTDQVRQTPNSQLPTPNSQLPIA